jgi:apolipoprotein N-acyltransferase
MPLTHFLRRTGFRSTARWGAIALAVAAGLTLAEPPSTCWPLAGFALAPWLVAVARSRLGAALVGSAFVGAAWAYASAPWVPGALRSLDAGPVAALTGSLVAAVWVKGIPFATVGALVYAGRRTSRWRRIVLTGGGFFLVDGAHSTFAWGVPWALLGHSQGVALGVAQLAAVGGVPLLSGLLAAINQAAAIVWEERGTRGSLRLFAALVAAWVSLALIGLPLAKVLRQEGAPAGGSEVSLLVVQPHIPRGEHWAENLQASHLSRLVTATERALAEPGVRPAAVLWPENLLTSPVDRVPELAAVLQESVDRLGVPVILGAVRSADGRDPDRYRSSVLWVEPQRGIVAAIDKTRAFPLVEARTHSRGAALVARAFGAAAEGKKVEEAAHAGPLQGGFTLTAVLCYEALFPGIVAERRAPESVAIVNLADDGWLGEDAPTRQLAAFASFRAIEQRLPFVRVTHGGLSLAVDAFGESLLEVPRNTWAHGRVEVRASAPPALADRLALLALPLSTGLGVWWALAGRARGEGARATAPGAHCEERSSP